MPNDWPLIGRGEELAYLGAALTSGSVLISGPAGVGKSRLARELVDACEGAGRRVVRVRATAAAATVPLGAFAPLLPSDAVDTSGDRLSTLIAAGTAIVGDDAPIVAVDDAHLLDELSAALVHQLSGAPGVSLVVTVRTGQPADDAVVALWKDGLASTVELQSLSRPETEALVSEALPGVVEARTLERLWMLSQGNPLYLREIVVAGLESEGLQQIDGMWRLDASDVGTRLSELVEARLGRLDDTSRRVLELLAFGEPMSLDLIVRIEPDAPLADLERRGLIRVETSERREEIRLAHPLYTEVLRARTPTLEAARIQRALADTVEALGSRRREDLLRVASWRVASRSKSDPDVMYRAARAAHRSGDYVTGERFVRIAVDADPTGWHLLILAVSLRYQLRLDEALEALGRIPEDDPAHAEGEFRTSLAQIMSETLQDLGRTDDALAFIEGLEDDEPEGYGRAYLRAARSGILSHAGRFREAIDLGLPLVTDESLDVRVRLRALEAIGDAWAGAGCAGDALNVAMTLYPEARRLRDVSMPNAWMWIGVTIFFSLILLGRLADARALLDLATNEMSHYGRRGHWSLRIVRGRLALFEGKPQTALADLLEMIRGTDPLAGWADFADALVREAYALVGDHDAASAIEQRPKTGHLTTLDYDIDRASASIDALTGDVARARQRMRELAARLATQGQHNVEAHVLHEVVRLDGAADVVERLRELEPLVDGAWAALFVRHADALLAGDGDALDAVSAGFSEIGANLLAAEAAYEASRAHRHHGLAARASASAARGEQLASRCEGATTPALVAARAPVGLTRREREIGGLAASGLSNKEIAERLVVSVRTVESHLQEVYTKLGITSRAHLAEYLAPEGPPARHH